jgi:hypothetical protein
MNAGGSSSRFRSFVFRGNAVAAAGHLVSFRQKPVPLSPDTITVHGESSLPVVGGVSESSLRPRRLAFRESIQYGQCQTFAAGVVNGDTAVTIVASAVDDVRVTARPTAEDQVPHLRSVSFRADRLSIAIRSTHPDGAEAQFDLLREPETDNMHLVLTDVNRKEREISLRLEFDRELLSCRTFSELRKSEQFGRHATRQPNGYIITSIVRRIYRDNQPIEGYVLREPGLGTIYFGEVLINDHNRRITLVRVEMGSDLEGRATMASADPNGIWG